MSADERPRLSPAAETLAGRKLRCRRCERLISSSEQVFSVDGSPAVAAYSNPSGQLREVVAVRDAEGLRLWSSSSVEMTWFLGYAWRIASCLDCSAHLGWRYEALDPKALPAQFFGLLTAAIIER